MRQFALSATIPLLGLALLTGCRAGPGQQNADVFAGCTPTFPHKQGWLGGDAAYSVAMPGGRSLWFFGDTIVSKSPEETTRANGDAMVRNSVGVSTCAADGGWDIDYYWGNQFVGEPKAFFASDGPETWYWPADGFLFEGNVYVVLRTVVDAPDKDVFPFEMTGAKLARISNLEAAPVEWDVQIFELLEGTPDDVAATVVVDGGFLYLFNVDKDGSAVPRPLTLARIPLTGLSDPASHLEYLAEDGTWRSGYGKGPVLPVMKDSHSEMSIRFHAGIRRWVAVTSGPEFLSNYIMVRTAPALTGPWGEPQRVYDFPEMQPASASYDRDTSCYAVKEQVQFSSANEIMITYVCNSFDFGKMIANEKIYRPRAVQVSLPAQDE